MSNKATTCNTTHLQSAYDRNLPDIGGMLEKSLGHDRNGIKLITKAMSNWEHCVSTGHGTSEKHYGWGTYEVGRNRSRKQNFKRCEEKHRV